MNKTPIIVPASAMPKKDPEHPCPCQDIPVKLTYKSGTLLWLREVGDFVRRDEVVCEGEVEKKALEFPAPCDGYLVEKTVGDDESFNGGDTLGYLCDEKPEAGGQ